MLIPGLLFLPGLVFLCSLLRNVCSAEGARDKASAEGAGLLRRKRTAASASAEFTVLPSTRHF